VLAGEPQKKALFTSASMRPNRYWASCKRHLHCAASRTSVGCLSTWQSGFTAWMLRSASSSFSAVRAPTARAVAPSRAASTASFTPRPGPIP